MVVEGARGAADARIPVRGAVGFEGKRAMGDILNVVWLIILLQLFVPVLQRQIQTARRRSMIRQIERMRGSRVITIIHRQGPSRKRRYAAGRFGWTCGAWTP